MGSCRWSVSAVDECARGECGTGACKPNHAARRNPALEARNASAQEGLMRNGVCSGSRCSTRKFQVMRFAWPRNAVRLLSATRGRHHRTGEGGRRGKGRTGACVGPLDSPRNAPRVVAAGVRFRSSRAYSPTNQKSTALDCAHEERRCERPDSAPPPPRCVVEDVDHASTATSARPAPRGATKKRPSQRWTLRRRRLRAALLASLTSLLTPSSIRRCMLEHG